MKLIKSCPWRNILKITKLDRSWDLDPAILERISNTSKIGQCPSLVISAGFSFPSTINPTFSFHTSADRLCLNGVCSVSKGGINCLPKDTILEANRKDLVLMLTKTSKLGAKYLCEVLILKIRWKRIFISKFEKIQF